MKFSNLITAGLATLIIMTSISALGGEKLVPEDGKVSALVLPLDQELSKIKFETATFGMG